MTAPLTYLQLAQIVRQEVGAAGSGPTTTVSQSGEYKRIVDWVAQADAEIQQEHDEWRFMVGSFAVNTVVGTASYLPSTFVTPVTDLRQYKERTIKAYLLSAGVSDQNELRYLDFEDWDIMYNTGAQTNSRPIHWTIGNALELLIGPHPADVYRITGLYQKTVTTLTGDAATPIYPAEFHMLPAYLAMMKYGRYTAASEVFNDAERLYKKMLIRMERSQMPRWNRRIPLA
jgi:hypothetical protein